MNHLFNDMPFCWQNLDGFITEDIPTTEPYLCELGADQHQYNPFVLSPIRPEYPCLVSDAPDSILPSPFFTELADIAETTPLQFTEQYSQTRDSFLVPQYVQNMEPLHRALEIPRGTSVDSFGSNALLRSTERVDPHSEKENQILAISKSYNTNETNGANQETKKFQSPFEQYNVQSAEVFKPRMRWTPELHERFVQAINHLGGPDKTTPRSILIKMGVNGLTVDHVKSHLQKYRQAREQPEAKEEKRASCSEWKKKNSTEKDNKFLKVSTEESGTLHMQWKLQKTLHDQLKIIRELQLQTEENGRRLQKFVENQDKMREAFMQATQSLSSTCKVKNTEEPLSQACNSKEDEEILTNDLLEENCFVQSNFESNVPFHKKARLDI